MCERVLGVLGGEDMSDAHLSAWAASAAQLYAADSAGSRLVRLGFRPVVVGDLDSFDPAHEPSAERVVKDADPDRTDCDKLLATVAADGHQSLTVACIEGDLLDHVLASLSSMAATQLRIRLVLRAALATLLRGGDEAVVPDAVGRRVSLIPLVPCSGATLTGVLWEVQEALMQPAGFLSVSNEGVGDVRASLRSGAALLIVGRDPSEPPLW